MAKPGPQIKSKYEARLTEVWRMWNRGHRQWQIAAAIGITDRQVRYDLKTLENRWRKETSAGIAAHKEKVLAENQELLITYWQAWQHSLEEKTTSSTEKSAGDAGNGERLKAAIKKEQREGNPAFLDGVMKCLQERCKILGLNAPIKYREVSELTDEELNLIASAGSGDNPTASGPGVTET